MFPAPSANDPLQYFGISDPGVLGFGGLPFALRRRRMASRQRDQNITSQLGRGRVRHGLEPLLNLLQHRFQVGVGTNRQIESLTLHRTNSYREVWFERFSAGPPMKAILAPRIPRHANAPWSI